MKHALTAFAAIGCVVFLAVPSGQAQNPNTATIGFTNRSDVPVIVKGYTLVNGVQRGGPVLVMKPNGGRAFETNVPIGLRLYTIYDPNNPARILLKDHVVPIRTRAVLLAIVPSPTNPTQLTIVLDRR
ncbi:MAG: hypothetical protein HYX68_09845 [Planctomycetes bacterium]|nr:hypothetical protein [Planctomycetota bacterium]